MPFANACAVRCVLCLWRLAPSTLFESGETCIAGRVARVDRRLSGAAEQRSFSCAHSDGVRLTGNPRRAFACPLFV
ncbi:hypothetical protein WS67_13090 [Burkholderia singularis]|uniref:Uncharacterized protein n=1 Tax=Burkholderia singularis TaxID=1503053 RepID=A0A103E1A2_9BURK|nr:hypothetical protein WS67_13090 [Burkholderia singularis]